MIKYFICACLTALVLSGTVQSQEKTDKIDIVLKQLGEISKNLQELQKDQKQNDGRLDAHQLKIEKTQGDMNKLKADLDNLRKTVEDMKKAPIVPIIPPYKEESKKPDDRPPIIEATVTGPDGITRKVIPKAVQPKELPPTVPYYPKIEKIKAEAWFVVTNNWEHPVTMIVNDQPYEIVVGSTRKISVQPGKVTYRLLEEGAVNFREKTLSNGETFRCSIDPNPSSVRQSSSTRLLYWQPGQGCSPGYYFYK